MSIGYLQEAGALSATSLDKIVHSTWDPQQLGLLFRLSCLGPSFANHALHLPYAPIDLNTGWAHDPQRDPLLSAMLDTATRAGLGCQLLFEAATMTDDQEHALLLARRLYIKRSLFIAQQTIEPGARQLGAVLPETSVDAFKQRAIVAFLRVSSPGIPRPWAALLTEDVRWCLACTGVERAALKEEGSRTKEWPATKEWLDAFDLQLNFLSPREALAQVWAVDAPRRASAEACEQTPLPHLGV